MVDGVRNGQMLGSGARQMFKGTMLLSNVSGHGASKHPTAFTIQPWSISGLTARHIVSQPGTAEAYNQGALPLQERRVTTSGCGGT
jgi:hypothetical protein